MPRSLRKLRIGLAGLGRGFMLMLPTIMTHPKIEVVAAADPREEARRQFEKDFGGRRYASVDELCADASVEAVYIATPHQFHAENVIAAASKGKHVLVEKPMALTLDECKTMIDATRDAGVRMLVGHSHSFDAPIARAREMIESGEVGRVHMIAALNFTDFLYRPRRPEELDSARGGGVAFSQAAHQVDVVRLLAGGKARSVRAMTGAWDPSRPTEGAYTALLTFDNGAFATLTYSGYAHFDSDEFCGWIGELGHRKDPRQYAATRAMTRKARSPEEETALKNSRAYGAAGKPPGAPDAHNHFGLVIVSCEHADLRPMPNGVIVYGDDAERFEPIPAPAVPRVEVFDELYDTVVLGRPGVHTGAWAMATLEVCLAILQSSRENREIGLSHQVEVMESV